jgi:3-oxoacyl-[acyl-carrier protein] reductase
MRKRPRPERRATFGTPEDHVGALLFLLSEDASWVTGQIFATDGGQIVRT